MVSLEHFGASAAYQTLYEEFGITAEAVAAAARESVAAAAADAAPATSTPREPEGDELPTGDADEGGSRSADATDAG